MQINIQKPCLAAKNASSSSVSHLLNDNVLEFFTRKDTTLTINRLYCIYLYLHSSNQTRPGDVYHPDFERGLPAYFDLSVRSSLQPSFLTQAASHPGAASDAGEMEKKTTSSECVQHRQPFSSASSRDSGSLDSC